MSKKTGFLVGALVGAAAALFLAPKKGSELREGAGKIYDDLKENPQETLTKWDDIIDLEAKVDPAIKQTSFFLTNTSGFTALKKVKNALGD